MKVTLRAGQEIPAGLLADGTRVAADLGFIRLLPPGDAEDCVRRLLPLKPVRLEYGRPELEEIYARLYFEEAAR